MPDGEKVLFHQEFAGRQFLGESWQLLAVPPADFVADDGVFDATDEGLRVRASGAHPITGAPSFTKDRNDMFSHIKWMATLGQQASSGFPGFDVPSTGILEVEYVASARTHGTDAHPFGDAVEDPETDLRLACCLFNLLDFEAGTVFDFCVTNRAVRPFYERLMAPDAGATHQAFSSIFAPVPRVPDQRHRFAFRVDAAAGRVAWCLDGEEIAAVTDIGKPSRDARVILDHGGTPQSVTPRQLLPCISLMTLLDADLNGAGEGLAPAEVPYVAPTRFRGSDRLWGQGAELTIASIKVTTRPR